jgi:hypothetical protein
MAEKTPAEKMRLKPGMTAISLHTPEGMASRLGLPEAVSLTDDPGPADFLLDYASTQAEAEARLTALAPHVGERTLTWLAYPKGSKAAGYDLSRDTIFIFAPTIGLTVVANIAIDEAWSAVRLRPL